jgi:hypothetical protein
MILLTDATLKMSTVFISYRREDTAPHAGRLHDRLVALFGDGSVFMDVQDIHPGADFRQTIQQTIAGCDVLICIIGPHWLASLQARAGHEEDMVSEEILAALAANTTIVPVLVGGAVMPAENDVPEALRPLTRRQAIEIRDARFDDGFQQLAGFLQTLPGVAPFNVSGQWTAEMERTDAYAVREHLPPFRSDLDLYVVDGAISGSVVYPTGAAMIEDGAVTGRRITFRTSHVPQFEEQRAIIRFMGEIVKNELHLTSVDEHGIVCRGIARRAGAAS